MADSKTTQRYLVRSGWWASHYVVDTQTGKIVSHEYDLVSDAEENADERNADAN